MRESCSAVDRRMIRASGLSAFLAFSLTAGCSLCTTTELNRAVAPDGRYTAFVLLNECGATVRDARQVTLVEGSALPRPGWFSSVIEEGTVLRVEGNAELSVIWTSSSSLKITYRRKNRADRIYRQEGTWGPIRVDFVQR